MGKGAYLLLGDVELVAFEHHIAVFPNLPENAFPAEFPDPADLLGRRGMMVSIRRPLPGRDGGAEAQPGPRGLPPPPPGPGPIVRAPRTHPLAGAALLHGGIGRPRPLLARRRLALPAGRAPAAPAAHARPRRTGPGRRR